MGVSIIVLLSYQQHNISGRALLFLWSEPTLKLAQCNCCNIPVLALLTSAVTRVTLDTSDKFLQQRKKRLRLHSFGPLWTISTGNQWEISEFGRLSCFSDFFVWFHIVCDRYTSYYAHFTFSDTIWPLSLSSDFGTRSCTHTDTVSYIPLENPLIPVSVHAGRAQKKRSERLTRRIQHIAWKSVGHAMDSSNNSYGPENFQTLFSRKSNSVTDLELQV